MKSNYVFCMKITTTMKKYKITTARKCSRAVICNNIMLDKRNPKINFIKHTQKNTGIRKSSGKQ